MNYIKNIQQSILNHIQNDTFCINDIFYSYQDLAIQISKIRLSVSTSIKDSNKLIGLILNDDLNTYAAIIAFWLEGKAYVPINPEHPEDRNETILESTECSHIFDSTEKANFKNFKLLTILEDNTTTINLELKQYNKHDLAYILFTSGSTGSPKGVPITYNNLNEYVNAINFDGEFELNAEDKCLQMFELTFDFSVVSYIFPLLTGACIYTVPRNSIKYFYIYKLIKKHKLTVLSLVPSIAHYLKPYFDEINAPEVRYCSFGGGALYNDIVEDWYQCVPNCSMFNYYGPTENTIYSSYYKIKKDAASNITYNGILSIGKPLHNVTYIIINENNEEIPDGETGELALSSGQLTPGYWKNKEKNDDAFFIKNINNTQTIFYKTGDLCFKEPSGNFMYLGRIDFQVKIRGFRIELTEVEFHAKVKCEEKVNLVAIDVLNNLGNSELALAIESQPFETDVMIHYMKSKLPDYMIPDHIEFINEFPYNTNGKIDRNKLRTYFNTNKHG